MAGRNDVWELKQAAKWSLDLPERVRAVRALSGIAGQDALRALNEVKVTTVYEEIRNSCIEAIKSAHSASIAEKNIPGEKQEAVAPAKAPLRPRNAPAKKNKSAKRKPAQSTSRQSKKTDILRTKTL